MRCLCAGLIKKAFDSELINFVRIPEIKNMTTRLLFQFANSDLGSGFEILNPPVLPVSGEILDFK